MQTAGWRVSDRIEDRRNDYDASALVAIIEQGAAPILSPAPDLGAADPGITVLFWVATILIHIKRKLAS